MSSIDFESLEAYLFAEDKQEFLSKLIPNTEPYLFFSLLHSLNSSETLSHEAESRIEDYKKKFGSVHSQNIHLRALLKKFDNPSLKPEEKAEIISKIQGQFNFGFNFHYSKPSNIVTSALQSTQKTTNSTLDPKLVTFESQTSNVYNYVNSLNSVTVEALSRLDFNKILSSPYEVQKAFAIRAIATDFEDFPKLILEVHKKDIHFQPSFDQLTLEQLETLKKSWSEVDSRLLVSHFKKVFGGPSYLVLKQGLSRQEKRDLAFKIYNWAIKEYPAFRLLKTRAIYEVLDLDIELNNHNQALFLEYLKDPLSYYAGISQSHPKYSDQTSSQSNPIDFGEERVPENILIKTYLEEFFKSAKDTSTFEKLFEKKFLTNQFYSTKLMLGQAPESTDVLTPEDLKTLVESKDLTICGFNPEYYKGTDPVTLHLRIKNIPSLMVKVFEFQPESYYIKQQKQLDGAVNLDGLVAAREFNIDFKEPPARKFIKEFKFDSVSEKKQGIFIIDFIGNGLSSRAIIRKGKLAYVEKQTSAGQLFTIVDEDAKVIKEGRVGMWIKGTFYQPDEKGRILVPYSSPQKEKAILVNNDYAELVDVDLKAENWEFRCSYIYDYESFLMGNKAKILLQPRLFLNQQPIGLEILEDCSAMLTTLNNDGIPSKTAFEKLKFSATEEVELEFPVPAKLNQITISVQAKITPVNQKEPQQYNSSETINVEGTVNTQIFCNLYLRYSKNGYEVYLLGRNGEPKSGVTVSLTFTHKYLANSITVHLQTDDQGKVSLGKLEDISSVTASIQTIGDINTSSRSWNINNYKSVNYPRKIRICEGEQIKLPLLHNELNKHKMRFVETLPEGYALKNRLNSLKIDKKRLIISDLKEGHYELYLKDVKTSIPITVIKGAYWPENPGYLLQKDSLVDIKADVNNIVVTNVKTEVKENSDLADVIIEAFADQPQLTRFHIFGCHFMEPDTNRTVDNLDAHLSLRGPESEAFLGLKKSQFLNKRSLGDEYTYVLNRKSQSRYLGNTLEKPSILIKKTFVRDTQSTEEQLSDTQQFKSHAPAEEERAKRSRKADHHQPRSPIRAGGHRGIDGFLNFLTNPCLISSNQKLNENGVIVIPNFPINKYSFIKIVATNLTANICELFPLEPSKIQTKDLTQKAREEGAVFSINRNSSGLLKGEKIKVKDLTSSEIQVIDSVTKLFDVQKNLALSGDNPSSSTEFEKWDFLKGWDTLDFEEKLKKYDKFASHELNIFTCFKDHDFFKKVALPFLQNKIEKTFIDYFLINDQDVIKKYSGIEKFKDLNSLEQVLLIYRLHHIDPQQAKTLAYSLEQRDSLNKVELNIFKRYFDTALSVKQADDFSSGSGDPMGGAGGLGAFSQMQQPQMPYQNMIQQAMPAQYSLNMMSNMAPPPQMARMQQTYAAPAGAFGAAPQQRHMQQQSYNESADLLGLNPYGVSTSANRYMGAPQEMQYQSYVGNPYGGVARNVAAMDDFDSSEAEHFKQKRAVVRAGFQELEKTKEYCERNYYEKSQKNISIPLNKFWVDVAKNIVDNGFTKPLLTSNFIYAHFSATELIAVLSIISLPFKAGSHEYKSYEGRGVEIQAASDFIILTKAVTEVESELSSEILVIQKFYDPSERYIESEEEAGLIIEKEIDQYIINKVYGGTVIVTNSSGSNQQFQVLVEIPEGAIPLNSYGYTKSHTLQLNAYSTQTVDFFFYFPHVGKFKVNPPNVSKKGMVLARGKKLELEVKAEKVYTSLETLNAVLTQGSQEDVLNFARTKNIWNQKVFDFNAIYWLLSDKDFFLKFIQILRERKVFNAVVWQFGFYHKDVQTIQEYFGSLAERTYPGDILYVNSSLLQVDKLKLLEYNPFVNQRVHLLASEKNRILNLQFKEQYRTFVKYLCERNKLETEHYLALVYYLLLQDRVDEAIKFFAKIDRDEVRKTTKYELQYDYFAAYIDFYIGYPNFSVAREVCQKYLNYPVLAWRTLFLDVAEQLAEFDGKEVLEEEVSQKDKKKQNLINANKEETVSMEIQQTKLHITYQNVKEITLAFYRVDLEVLFSRNPFIAQSKDEFSFIRPNEMKKIETSTSKDLEKLVYEIPEALQKYNLYIELRTKEKTLSSTYFSTSLEVQIIENYGQVKVLDQTSKPLTKVYVKCFAQTNDGRTSFYKDGYTDLRGRFDYATLNSSDISTIKKFSIFIMSDDFGSLIKEVKAPNKLSKIDS